MLAPGWLSQFPVALSGDADVKSIGYERAGARHIASFRRDAGLANDTERLDAGHVAGIVRS